MNERIALTLDMIQDDGSMNSENAKVAGSWLNNVLSISTYATTDTWATTFMKMVVDDLDEETLKVYAFVWLKGLLNERNNY
ncbi:MAG TPA: hypothetical protein PKJ52_01145 [Rectinema sp.]|nr:hypothetical protein [Rectinema sp.]